MTCMIHWWWHSSTR